VSGASLRGGDTRVSDQCTHLVLHRLAEAQSGEPIHNLKGASYGRVIRHISGPQTTLRSGVSGAMANARAWYWEPARLVMAQMNWWRIMPCLDGLEHQALVHICNANGSIASHSLRYEQSEGSTRVADVPRRTLHYSRAWYCEPARLAIAQTNWWRIMPCLDGLSTKWLKRLRISAASSLSDVAM
jgi:hypothetical protein